VLQLLYYLLATLEDCHGERLREPRNEVAVALAIGHALRAHEALSRPDALSGFLEVVHSLFEDGVFVGHEQSIRSGIFRSPSWFTFPGEHGPRSYGAPAFRD
jgi:hypothetical protein